MDLEIKKKVLQKREQLVSPANSSEPAQDPEGNEAGGEPQDNAGSLKLPKELQELLEAGVQFGHKKSVVHPGMFPYIFGVRNNIHIIDVGRTQEKLKEALDYIKELIKEGKTILFIGTKMPVRHLIKSTASETSMPYVVTYWAGGILTNWEIISERIERMRDLRKLKKSEEWKKYTKNERLGMSRELNKLQERWEGVEGMKGLPDAVFIVDMNNNATAAREAKKKNIPIIAIVNTNINPKNADYIIPANDNSLSSIELILNKVKKVILKNKSSSSSESEKSGVTKPDLAGRNSEKVRGKSKIKK